MRRILPAGTRASTSEE